MTLPARHQVRWDCGGDTLRQSWEAIEGRIDDAANAQKLANAVLCLPGHDKDVADYIGAHFNESVVVEAFETGDPEEDRTVLTREEARSEGGWGFSGSKKYEYSVDLDDEGSILLFASEEECVAGFILVRKHGDWLISESRSACG